MDGFLLDVDYKTIEEKPVVRLFLRNTMALDPNVRPYLYVLAQDPDSLKEPILKIEMDGGSRVTGVEVVEKGLLGRPKRFLKVYLRHPQDVPRIRDRLRDLPGVSAVHEDDILFSRRYLMDKGLTPTGWVEVEGTVVESDFIVHAIRSADGGPIPPLRVMSFDMEVYNPKGAPRGEVDPIIMVSVATSGGVRKVISWKAPSGTLGFVETVADEAAVLKRFDELVREEDPDIVVGYNTDNFDFPYLNQRLKVLGLELGLGRDGSPHRTTTRAGMSETRMAGRPHLDLYPIVRRSLRLSSYVLEDVVQEILGEEKEKVPNERMGEIWDRGGHELDQFFRYSLEDAEVTLRLGERYLPLYIELSRLVGQPLQDVARMTTGQLVEWYLMREAATRGEVIPERPRGREFARRAGDTYEGGYVREPKKGLSEDIVVFDFRSLYPSVIVTHNIDPSTIRPGPGENQPPGIDFHFSTEKEGFIPALLKGLVERRAQVKGEMKAATDEGKRKMLDVQQQALKILANSFYGYMGYPRSRWYRKECAESVTAFARDYIRRVMEVAEKEFGLEVVYGDTDSLFVLVPRGEREKAMAFLEEVNRRLPGTIELEYEGYYRRGIFVTKKRYALIDEKDRITVKGLEFVRRDWAAITKDTQEKVLMALLKDASPEEAVKIVRRAIEDIRARRVSLEDLTIYTQLTKKISSYKNVGPHVEAAKKLMEAGREVSPGMIIGYIIGKGSGLISKRAIPVELASLEDYDPEYYIENQIFPAVLRIIEAMGYSKSYLRDGVTQVSMDKWF
jgi:DNA polymerase I